MDSSLTMEEINTFINELDGPSDIDKKTEALRKLIQHVDQDNEANKNKDYYNNDHFVIRKLIDRWVMWIALDDDDRQYLISTVARKLRTKPDAVHSLVDHFAFNLKLSSELKTKIIIDAIEQVYYPFLKHYKDALFDNQAIIIKLDKVNPKPDSGFPYRPNKKKDRKNARNLLDSLANRWPEAEISPEYEELGNQLGKINIQTFLDKLLDLLFEEERLRREMLVYQSVTSQLAHMSDRRFYGTNQKQYDRVHMLLKEHAVPVIVFNLPKHTDLETRWHVGLMLGYIGGRLAIDGLVTALIDEKSTRDARQKMLSKYYLEPADRQSQQAIKILDLAVKDARSTMQTQRFLNICIVSVGIMLFLTGIYLVVFPREGTDGSWERYSGFIPLIGGIGTILYHLISKPLDRIQNAMANLVQLETAFTNFIWELNLNGAYIQSRYVADGRLTDYEISQTMQRLEKSMTLTMNQIAKHTEVVEETMLPRINKLNPATGKSGSTLEIRGQNLFNNRLDIKDHEVMLNINHTPSDVEGLEWEENRVRFIIPDLKESGTVWFSLVIDGNETNALRFNVET